MKMHWQILIALVAALLLGALLNSVGGGTDAMPPWALGVLSVCEFCGEMFMNALKMVIVPLIVSSIVLGIAGLGMIEGFGRLGLKTIGYYALSSFVAIVIGLAAVNLIKPGLVNGLPNQDILRVIDDKKTALQQDPDAKIEAAKERKAKDVVEVLKRMIPVNVVKAAAEGQMLGLIFFSILFGAATTAVRGSPGRVMVEFFQGLNDIMILITKWVMIFAPLGVFALVTPTVATLGITLVQTLMKYFFTVSLALGAHFLIALPLLLKLVGRVDPWRHFSAMKTALMTAFSTASSAATLPITIRGVRDNAGVSNRVTSFVLPLGATVNMDGTALYECVAVIFIAQVLGIEMSVGQQFLVVFLALITSIGVAGIPSASLVAILIIMNNVGIPNADAAMGVLLAVDRILDMFRTSVNVFSDSCGAVVIGRSEGEANILVARPEAA